MFKRGLALSLVLGVASAAFAGTSVTVRLVPSPSTNPFNPAGMYEVGETDISVDVYLTQSSGADLLLRHVQFNLAGTDASLLAGVSMPVTHVRPIAGDISFWDFSSTSCSGELCGAGHYIDDNDPTPGPDGIATTFSSSVDPPASIPADTDADSGLQVLLPADRSCVRVGRLNVSIPAGGPFTLDLVNVGEADPELAGRVSYGFGLSSSLAAPGSVEEANDLMAVTTHGVGGGGGPLSGGTLVLNHITQDVVVSAPDDGKSLPSTKQNVIKVGFGSSIAADAADAALHSMVTVHELLPCGDLGPNLATLGNVRFDIEDGGTTLRITDVSEPPTSPLLGIFAHQVWYAVVNDGSWAAATPFKVDVVGLYGDVDDTVTTFTDFGDVSALLGVIDLPATDANRRADIDGSGFIDFGDVSALLGTIDTGAPARPFGH